MKHVYYLLLAPLFMATTACAEELKPSSPVKFETLKCLGTEPFWSIDVKDNNLSMEDLNGTVKNFTLNAAIQSDNHNNRWFLKANDNKDNSPVILALTKSDQCSDDMSDFNYEYDVTALIQGDKVLSGCCNRIAHH